MNKDPGDRSPEGTFLGLEVSASSTSAGQRMCKQSGVFRGKQGLLLHVKARGFMQVRSGNGKKKVHGQHFEGKSKKPDNFL